MQLPKDKNMVEIHVAGRLNYKLGPFGNPFCQQDLVYKLHQP